jgi:hypothetical protein
VRNGAVHSQYKIIKTLYLCVYFMKASSKSKHFIASISLYPTKTEGIKLLRVLPLSKSSLRRLYSATMSHPHPSSCSSSISSDVVSSKNNEAETYTSFDAAAFSRKGACMIALPADNSHTLFKTSPRHTSEMKMGRSTGYQESEYTAADAAEFSRRGASMVAHDGDRWL